MCVGARDGNSNCDLTRVDLTLRSGDREWDLARDVSGDILAANPHADGQGNAGVWHFAADPEGAAGGWTIPAGSLLGRWIKATGAEDRGAIAADIGRLLADDGAGIEKDSPDAQLRQLLRPERAQLFGAFNRVEQAELCHGRCSPSWSMASGAARGAATRRHRASGGSGSTIRKCSRTPSQASVASMV